MLPVPHLFDELLAPQLVAGVARCLQLPLDHNLRGNAGVVGANNPVGIVAQHAVITDQRVHQRLLEGVAHVQGAGDVRRRQLDGVGGLGGVGIVFEMAGSFPLRIPFCFDGAGVK